MNTPVRDRVKQAPAAAGRLARDLFREMAPPILFFFIAFMVIFLLFKLFVAEYSISFYAFSRAAVAALILGKVVPLLDWAGSGHTFATHRRIVVVAGKTVVYGLAVMVLGTGERVVDARLKEKNWKGAVDFVLANSNWHHVLGLVLLISLVVGVYLTIQEISRAMGRGALFRLLFERPVDHNG